jgi:hypothetical protein
VGLACAAAPAVAVKDGVNTLISSVGCGALAGAVEAGCRQATSASNITSIPNHLSAGDFFKNCVFILLSSPSYTAAIPGKQQIFWLFRN